MFTLNMSYLNRTPNKTPRSTRSFRPRFIVMHEVNEENILEWYLRSDVRSSYNYIIERNGVIFHYVDERSYISWHVGAKAKIHEHIGGQVNIHAIGIALEGPNNGTLITAEQAQSLLRLFQYLRDTYGIGVSRDYIYDHKTVESNDLLGPKGYIVDDLLTTPFELIQRLYNESGKIEIYKNSTQKAKQPLNDIKIVFVGDGGVGKTSIIRRLQGLDLRTEEVMTRGITIQQIQGRDAAKDITYSIWDFGGQELLHATHSLFFTTRTIYIVVIDGRSIDPEQRLPYWMQQIQQRGGESSVVLVVNKIDQYHPALDKRGLLNEFRTLEEIIEVSCSEGYNQTIETLHSTLARVVAGVPHIHDTIPTSWSHVRTYLQEQTTEYVPLEQFVNICKSEGIVLWEEQNILLHFLHDLGNILYFDDTATLQNMGVLNPMWVTDAIYSILTGLVQRKDTDGVINTSDIATLLDEQRYPPYRYTYILALMERLELCWPLTHDSWLLPNALHPEQPELGSWQRALVFEYHYSSIPAGLFERLMVRLHSLIDRLYLWRTGMIVNDGISRALIRKDKSRPVIRISVDGSFAERRRFLRVLRFECDLLHQSYTNLEINQFVPLPNYDDILISYKDLLEYESAGETHYFVAKLRQRFAIKDLLNGYGESEKIDALSTQAMYELLDILKKRMSHLEYQKAFFGASLVPFHILNDIDETQKQIDHLLQRLETDGFR